MSNLRLRVKESYCLLVGMGFVEGFFFLYEISRW